MINVSIIGLGYVGLPLAIQFVESDVSVLGLDVDKSKVDSINQGRSYIRHVPKEAIERAISKKKLLASTDFSLLKGADAVIICVPTPLNKNQDY